MYQVDVGVCISWLNLRTWYNFQVDLFQSPCQTTYDVILSDFIVLFLYKNKIMYHNIGHRVSIQWITKVAIIYHHNSTLAEFHYFLSIHFYHIRL